MFARLGNSRQGQYEQREWSQLEAVRGRIDPTALNTTPGTFLLRLLSPSGGLLQGQMRTAHVVIIYLNVAGRVVGWQGCWRVYYSLNKFVFMFIPHGLVCSVCVSHPSEMVFETLTSAKHNKFHLNQKEHIVNATKLDCCFAFQTSTAQAVRGHCVHFDSSL